MRTSYVSNWPRAWRRDWHLRAADLKILSLSASGDSKPMPFKAIFYFIWTCIWTDAFQFVKHADARSKHLEHVVSPRAISSFVITFNACPLFPFQSLFILHECGFERRLWMDAFNLFNALIQNVWRPTLLQWCAHRRVLPRHSSACLISLDHNVTVS